MTRSTLKPGRQRDWEKTLFPDRVVQANLLWQNILNPDSLRFTHTGYKTVKQVSSNKFYYFKLESLTNQQLLQLDRLMTSPYHIRGRTMLELMGEADAIMLQLHANNLKQYLDNLAYD